MISGARAFTFRAGPYENEELVVVAFRGREELSRPFTFDVDLASASGEPVDAHALVDQDATLSIASRDGETRHVHGLVVRAEALGEREGRWRYRVRVVSRLQRLGLVRRSRIFQNVSVPDIVKGILDGAGISARFELRSSYEPREFCVQYRESDLNFLSRLLEAEGIFYFFEHAEDGHIMILGDASDVHPTIAGRERLPFRERGAVPDDDYVYALEVGRAIATGSVTLSDFDFVRPTLDLRARAAADDHVELEDYDHPGEYLSPSHGKRLSRIRLEEHRWRTEVGRGASICPRLIPGSIFELDEHVIPKWNRKWLVIALEHRARQPDALGVQDARQELYENEFRVIPAELPFRPPRRSPRPVVHGLQTAIVTGPPGEEIHTDEHGRIKLKFHWDREGKTDDTSSCWVRAGQAWAGPGWGGLHLPRVGMEVLVRFLDGNPDRPLVIGAVYNGHNPPPISLPEEKTKSVLRSNSSPGGDGANELTFEDAAGHELVYLHAQKDERIAVENDKIQSVGGHETLVVEKDRTRLVQGEQQLQVHLDDFSSIHGNQSTVLPSGNRITEVRGDHQESVSQNDTVLVALARKLDVKESAVETIAAGKALTVRGAYAIDVLGASTQLVGGAKTTLVGTFAAEEVIGFKKEIVAKGTKTVKVSLGEQSLEISKDYRRVVEKNENVEVGRCHLTGVKATSGLASKKHVIHADEFGVVVDGDVVLIVNKAGTVKIFGQDITIDGSTETTIKGKKVKKQEKGTSASKRLEEELTAAEADTIRAGEGENPMLSATDAKGFKDGKYVEKVLKKDMIFYRLHDGGKGAFPLGKWATRRRVPPGLEGKLRLALDPTWGNGATRVARIRVPAGTRVFEGHFAPQSGAYVGQGRQIAIAVPKELRGKQVADYLTRIGVQVLP